MSEQWSRHRLVPCSATSEDPAFRLVLVSGNSGGYFIPQGSGAFLARPGYDGDGWYAVPLPAPEPGVQVYLIAPGPGGYSVAGEDGPSKTLWTLSRAELARLTPFRIAAVVRPMTDAFRGLLERRIGEGGRP